jgi:membrane fusion protein, multidrug efflux system
MNEALKPDEVAQHAAPAPAEPKIEPMTVETPSPRRRNWVLWIVVVAALVAAAVYAWKKYESASPSAKPEETSGRPAQPPQTVRVAPVIVGDMPINIDALGTVTPFETVTIRTQIAGTLQNVGFTEGQTVKQGDFIAQIDPRPYEAALAQAQGQLAKDTALLTQAQGDLARYQQLAKQDSIAQQQVTDQMSLVAQDKAAIAADQAMVKTAELNVAYTHIVSPVTGRVGLRLVDPGNYLQPSDASGIVVITQIDPISVVFTTPESNLQRISARLSAGATLPVTVLDRDNVHALATGTLTTFDSQIDVTTGTIRMRSTFDNPKGVLFPNQFVNVRLLVDTMTGATLAPNAAIQLGASGDFVYLLKDDSTVAKRDVAVGPTDGKHTVITSGLAGGDKVVIDGVDRLRDGAKVKIADPAAAGGGQAGAGVGLKPGDETSANGSGHRHHPPGGQSGGAEACVAALAPEAKAIYVAAAPEFAASADPRAMVRAKVVDLVKAGTVQRDSAHESAVAAGACLKQLPSTGDADASGGASASPPSPAGLSAPGAAPSGAAAQGAAPAAAPTQGSAQ